MRQLVAILRRFDMVQVVKLRKIGKNPKNFRKNRVFEANKIAQAENFRNLLTLSERAFSCGSVFKSLNCLGEKGLEKNSRNLLMQRDVTFWQKNRRNCHCATAPSTRSLREGPGVMGSTEVRPSTPNCMGFVKIRFSQKIQQHSDFYSPFSQRPMIVG